MDERAAHARNLARVATLDIVMPLSNGNLHLALHIAHSASVEASNKFEEGQAVFDWWKGEYDRMEQVFYHRGL